MTAGRKIAYGNGFKKELIAINYFITKSISIVLQVILIRVFNKMR